MFCYYLLEDYSILMRDKTGVYSDGRDVEREWEKQYTGYIFEKKIYFQKKGKHERKYQLPQGYFIP